MGRGRPRAATEAACRMTIDDAIELVNRWLDAVDAASAQARVEAMQAEYRAKRTLREAPATATEAKLGRTALHEAAHAVIAHRGGLEVSHVCLHADGSGCADYRGPEDLQREIGADLAGVFVELLADTNWERQSQLAHSNDLLMARLKLDRLPETWRRALVTASCCSVLSNWSEIVRTATALRALGDLGKAEVAALCGRLQ